MADRLSDQFVAFLRMAPPERRAAWRRERMLQWGGVLLAWLWFGLLLFLLSPVAFSSVFSWYDVAPPNLGTACWDILTLLIVPIPILLFTAITVPSKAGWYGSEIVREDLLAGRNSLATVAFAVDRMRIQRQVGQRQITSHAGSWRTSVGMSTV